MNRTVHGPSSGGIHSVGDRISPHPDPLPKERENVRQRWSWPSDQGLPKGTRKLSPLPEGEGRVRGNMALCRMLSAFAAAAACGLAGALWFWRFACRQPMARPMAWPTRS
jgi:hypothetical protein